MHGRPRLICRPGLSAPILASMSLRLSTRSNAVPCLVHVCDRPDPMSHQSSLRIPDLQDKVVLITGASTGIGAGAARAFGANGAKVAVNFNTSRAEAEAVAADIRQ